MNFKSWLENIETSCLKGEFIYYPLNDKLQNAIKSDKSRGHHELIVNFYIQKNKKNLIKFYDDLKKDPKIDQEKLKNEIRIIIKNTHKSYFFFPPTTKSDITNDNFKNHYESVFSLIKKDIYNTQNTISNEEALSYFKPDAEALNYIIIDRYGDPNLAYHAMKYYKIIFVRSDVHFDMDEFDKNRLKKCIEAICKNNINPENYNTEIFINIFSSPTSSKSLTITIGDLLSDVKPQTIQSTEIKNTGLKVDPFSKAGIAQRDIGRELWKQRTSESMTYATPHDEYFNIANKTSEKYNLPKPTSFLNQGYYAKVFNTTNPNIIIRIAPISETQTCEKKINEKEVQNTGGVVKVYHQFEEDVNGEKFIVSYKEKVDTDWKQYLKNKYNPETFQNLLNVIQWELPAQSELYSKKAIETLKNYKETQNLVNAIEKGINNDDLHQDNLGINSNGNVVAIDC